MRFDATTLILPQRLLRDRPFEPSPVRRSAAPHPRFHGKAIAPILCTALRKLQSNFFAFFSLPFFSLVFTCSRGGRGGRRKDRKHAIGERYSSRTNINGPIASLLLRTGFAQMWDLRAFSEWERQSMLFVYCCRSPYYMPMHARSLSHPCRLCKIIGENIRTWYARFAY